MKRGLPSPNSAEHPRKRFRTERTTLTCSQALFAALLARNDALRARVAALERENARLATENADLRDAATANTGAGSLSDCVMRGPPRAELLRLLNTDDERSVLAYGAGVASRTLAHAIAGREALVTALHAALPDDPRLDYRELGVDVYDHATRQLLGSVWLEITPTQVQVAQVQVAAGDWQTVAAVDMSHAALRSILNEAHYVCAQKHNILDDSFAGVVHIPVSALRPAAWNVASHFELTIGQCFVVCVRLWENDACDIAPIRDALQHVGVNL